ncbi:MAG: lysophospholipase [Infirmifilum sp.]
MRAEIKNVKLENGFETIARLWQPNTTPKAVVLGIHGFAEHSGRYAHFGEYLVKEGFVYYMYDLRGHGLSKSEKGYIPSFEAFIEDTIHFYNLVRKEFGNKEVFLFGHSMGGLIATHVAARISGELKGLITSGAAVKLQTRFSQAFLLNLLALVTPRRRVPLPVRTECLTHDESVIKKYLEDPLVFKDPTVKLLVEFGKGISRVWRLVPSITTPSLVMHGGEDCLVPPDASKRLYDKLGSSDKKLRIYQGFRHEILNEPQWNIVASDIVGWLEGQL